MKDTNKKQEKASANQTAFEFIQEANPELTHEEVEDLDQALQDYLDLCREIYWERVKEGTFPWPEEDSTL